MAPVDLEARTRELEQLVRFVVGRVDSLREEEYVGTAADGLVTATLTGGTTTIGTSDRFCVTV